MRCLKRQRLQADAEVGKKGSEGLMNLDESLHWFQGEQSDQNQPFEQA
jgi:hypothetical protein